MPSPSVTKAIPSAWSSSNNRIRWRRFRPSRSNRQHTRTSNLLRRAAFNKLVKSWPAVLRTRHALVNVFDRGPPPALHIRAKFRELVFHVLVERGGTGIDGASRRSVVTSLCPSRTTQLLSGSYRDDVIVAGTSSVEHEAAADQIVIIGHHIRLPGWKKYLSNCGSAPSTRKLNVSSACPRSNSVLL